MGAPASPAAALLERDAAFAAAAGRRDDVETVVSFWTEDAVVVPPGQPPVAGRDALRAYVRESFAVPGFSISWEATADPVLSPDARMAYLWSRNTVSFTGPDGDPVTAHGRVMTVWRREDDGEWRCAVDIWNEAPQD